VRDQSVVIRMRPRRRRRLAAVSADDCGVTPPTASQKSSALKSKLRHAQSRSAPPQYTRGSSPLVLPCSLPVTLAFLQLFLFLPPFQPSRPSTSFPWHRRAPLLGILLERGAGWHDERDYPLDSNFGEEGKEEAWPVNGAPPSTRLSRTVLVEQNSRKSLAHRTTPLSQCSAFRFAGIRAAASVCAGFCESGSRGMITNVLPASGKA
jgi:hypothetical protein